DKKYNYLLAVLIILGILFILWYKYFNKSFVNLNQKLNKENNQELKNLKDNDIVVNFPHENEKIKSPLIINGRARGNWFFEAEFGAKLYDQNNNLLGQTILRAKNDWMTEDFVDFEGVMNFQKPETKYGKLMFLSANPSGISEYQKIYFLPIEFENINYQKVLLYYYNPLKDKDENGNILCSEKGLVSIQREIPLSQTPIKDTIELLLNGINNLTSKEKESGITTDFPLGQFKLKSLNLNADGTLILEFNDPLNQTSGGSCRSKILWLQIEQTAKQFNQVKKVEFRPEYLFQP
ncbi:MAG: GerMN domain-containing protein, partial [Minisyncoccia bacterium]